LFAQNGRFNTVAGAWPTYLAFWAIIWATFLLFRPVSLAATVCAHSLKTVAVVVVVIVVVVAALTNGMMGGDGIKGSFAARSN